MLTFLKNYLYAGIQKEPINFEQGGPECAAELPFDFQVAVNLSVILVNLLIMRMLTLRQYNIFTKKKRYLFEYICGYTLIVCLILQVVNKIATQSLIFMMNPCHLSAV